MPTVLLWRCQERQKTRRVTLTCHFHPGNISLIGHNAEEACNQTRPEKRTPTTEPVCSQNEDGSGACNLVRDLSTRMQLVKEATLWSDAR